MKIALIRKKYLPGKGGAEKVAEKFVNGFVSRGHDVTVLAEVFNADETDKLRWIKVPRLQGMSKTTAFHHAAQRVLNLDDLRAEFDITYSMCRTFPTDVFRITEQLHSEWLPRGYSRWAKWNPRHRAILKLERKSLSPKNVNMVVANSDLIRQQVIQNFKFPEDRVRVIYNGIDHEKFFPATPTEKEEIRKKLKLGNKFVCSLAASNFKIKGLAEAIEAIAQLNQELKEKLILVIIGDGKPQEFIRLAEKLKVADNLLFVGRQKNMRQYFIASDLLLCPSHYEPFGNVVLEACACGIPVITTKQNGSSEVITENYNGFLLEQAKDVTKMANLIGLYADLPHEEHLRFGENAVKAVENFTWQRHVDELEQIFQEVYECNSKNT